MQVTVLIEEPQGQTMIDCKVAWYVTTPSDYKILFIINSFERFHILAKKWNIPVEELDRIVLLPGEQSSIRGLEYFLINNNKAPIYLPRAGNEVRLHSLYHKLFLYTDPPVLRNWEKRVVYIDKFMDIGEMIQMIIKELKKSKKENCEEIQDENCNCNR